MGYAFDMARLEAAVTSLYGGGAAAVKDRLMPALMHASTLAGGSSVPVVYIDSRYSRSMNRNGLYEVEQLDITYAVPCFTLYLKVAEAEGTISAEATITVRCLDGETASSPGEEEP